MSAGHDASGFLHVSEESKAPYEAEVLTKLRADADEVIARYPQKRSALLPLLHLVQSVDGYVSGRGVEFCAEVLDLTTAEVSGVATFYTQYKRHPNGEFTVGVCTNTLCAIMGGDIIWDTVSAHLGIGHDETTEDGKITLERLECNAACDYAPVVMANWEFFDNQTPESTVRLVDQIRTGEDVTPTRGADKVCNFKAISRVLAGFPDGRADEGVGAGPASLVGLEIAKRNGWVAPGDEAPERDDTSPAGGATTRREPADARDEDEALSSVDRPSEHGKTPEEQGKTPAEQAGDVDEAQQATGPRSPSHTDTLPGLEDGKDGPK